VTPLHRQAAEEPERPRVRARTVVLHIVLSAALWITYFAYWNVVLKRGVGLEILVSLAVMTLFGLSTYGGTLWWVAHNRRLAQRAKGRRTGRPSAGDPPLEDFLGRRLEIPPGDAIKLAPRIVIHVEGVTKHFRPEDPVRAETEVVQEPA
jgi:hypothetical protein